MRFKDLFDYYDSDKSGTLEIAEMAKLVKKMVPDITVPGLRYLMVRVMYYNSRVLLPDFLRAVWLRIAESCMCVVSSCCFWCLLPAYAEHD